MSEKTLTVDAWPHIAPLCDLSDDVNEWVDRYPAIKIKVTAEHNGEKYCSALTITEEMIYGREHQYLNDVVRMLAVQTGVFTYQDVPITNQRLTDILLDWKIALVSLRRDAAEMNQQIKALRDSFDDPKG